MELPVLDIRILAKRAFWGDIDSNVNWKLHHFQCENDWGIVLTHPTDEQQHFHMAYVLIVIFRIKSKHMVLDHSL